MPTIDVNGTTLAYKDTGGPGPAIVFSHSLFFDRTMFAAQVERFGRAFRAVTYDHRGQGKSRRSSALDMDTLAADAAALIEALDLGPCHFVGNSMGGFVALRLAARRPELLRSAAVLSTSADAEGQVEAFEALLAYARAEGIGKTVDALVHIMFGDTTLADRPELRDHWRAEGVVHRKGVLNELVDVTVPLLVLSGAEDHAYSPELSQRIADTAANATHVRVNGAGHSLAVEQPTVVNDHLAEHFQAT